MAPVLPPELDHTAAQATFAEIAFGVNTLFGAYRRVRGSLQKHFQEDIQEACANVLSEEKNHTTDLTHLNVVKTYLEEAADGHAAFQKRVYQCSIFLSLFMAAVCIVILWFDALHWVGRRNWMLLFPFPAYCFATYINRLVFAARCSRKLGQFRKFMTFRAEFEP